MNCQQSRHALPIAVLLVIIMTSVSPTQTLIPTSICEVTIADPAQAGSQEIYHGGSIETISVTEYANLSDALAAVDSGQEDVLGHRINASDYALVDSHTSLKKQWAYDTLTCMLTVNTLAYPLSDVHLRRAIAFAIDKLKVASLALDNKVDSIDFAMPLCNEFSIEATEGGLFYESDIVNATKELALAGMLDVDNDSIVEAPNGNEAFFTLWYPYDREGFNETASMISADLLSAGINNTLVPMDYNLLQHEIATHNTSYNLALYHQSLPKFGFGWVATTFSGSNRYVEGENVANINSATLNDLATEYTGNIHFDETKDIGNTALRTVRNMCPVIPLFAYRWLSVYSDSNLEGWLNETNAGAFSVWNPVSVSAKTGKPNQMRVAVLSDFFAKFFTSLNPFRAGVELSLDWVSGYTFNPYLLIYDSLIASATDGTAVPRLSTSWEMLFLGIVSDLEETQSRAQYYIDPNANWTDGQPVDSQDFRFTFEYFANHSLTAYSTLIAGVKTVGDYVAGVDYDGIEMFLYRHLGSLPILPRHIWEDKDPSIWDPSIAETVGSGPYRIMSFAPNSSLVLAINDDYYPVIDNEPPTLRSIQLVPENPIPAETVVIRVHIDDRSRLENVTLDFTYQVGIINFTCTAEMVFGSLGWEDSIPARVTATRVLYTITATDIWHNSAIVASGAYSRPTTSLPNTFQNLAIFGLGFGLVGVAVVVVLFRRKGK